MKAIETRDGLILEIIVKPRSKAFRIVVEEDDIAIFCREEPIKGKVNNEIMRELSRLFRRDVRIISGFSSRQKKLLIRGTKKSEFEQILNSSRFQP